MDEFLRRNWFHLPLVPLGVYLAVRLLRLYRQSFRRRTAGWVTLDLGSVTLRHPGESLDAVVGGRLDAVFTDEVARLDGWFGRPLPHPPTVFLFPTQAEVGWRTGGHGGMAFPSRGRVVLPLDVHPDWLRMIARHELVHLHAYQFAGRRPPLMEEGLAGLVQTFHPDWPHAELPPPARWGGGLPPPDPGWPPLRALLSPGYFFARKRRAACYEAAASFSEYLVRRHGWPGYLAFYKRSRALLFHHHFRRAFGVSLRQAEREWRAGAWAVQSPSPR